MTRAPEGLLMPGVRSAVLILASWAVAGCVVHITGPYVGKPLPYPVRLSHAHVVISKSLVRAPSLVVRITSDRPGALWTYAGSVVHSTADVHMEMTNGQELMRDVDNSLIGQPVPIYSIQAATPFTYSINGPAMSAQRLRSVLQGRSTVYYAIWVSLKIPGYVWGKTFCYVARNPGSVVSCGTR